MAGKARGNAATRRGGNSDDDVRFFLFEQCIGRCRDQHSASTLAYDALDDANTPTRFSRRPQNGIRIAKQTSCVPRVQRGRKGERKRERERERTRPFSSSVVSTRHKYLPNIDSPLTPMQPLLTLYPTHPLARQKARDGTRIRKLHLR